MTDAPVPGGALAATERIQHRADKGSYNGRPLDALESIGSDAGVVAERLHEAITHLEAIFADPAVRGRAAGHAEAALGLIRGTE